MDPPSFACGMCGKCFSDAEQCRQHIQAHTGQQPFRCIICWPLFYDMPGREASQPCVSSQPVPPAEESVSSRDTSASQVTGTSSKDVLDVRMASAASASTTEPPSTSFSNCFSDDDPELELQGAATARADSDGFSMMKTHTNITVAANRSVIGKSEMQSVMTSSDKELLVTDKMPPDLESESDIGVSVNSEDEYVLELKTRVRVMNMTENQRIAADKSVSDSVISGDKETSMDLSTEGGFVGKVEKKTVENTFRTVPAHKDLDPLASVQKENAEADKVPKVDPVGISEVGPAAAVQERATVKIKIEEVCPATYQIQNEEMDPVCTTQAQDVISGKEIYHHGADHTAKTMPTINRNDVFVLLKKTETVGNENKDWDDVADVPKENTAVLAEKENVCVTTGKETLLNPVKSDAGTETIQNMPVTRILDKEQGAVIAKDSVTAALRNETSVDETQEIVHTAAKSSHSSDSKSAVDVMAHNETVFSKGSESCGKASTVHNSIACNSVIGHEQNLRLENCASDKTSNVTVSNGNHAEMPWNTDVSRKASLSGSESAPITVDLSCSKPPLKEVVSVANFAKDQVISNDKKTIMDMFPKGISASTVQKVCTEISLKMALTNKGLDPDASVQKEDKMVDDTETDHAGALWENEVANKETVSHDAVRNVASKSEESFPVNEKQKDLVARNEVDCICATVKEDAVPKKKLYPQDTTHGRATVTTVTLDSSSSLCPFEKVVALTDSAKQQVISSDKKVLMDMSPDETSVSTVQKEPSEISLKTVQADREPVASVQKENRVTNKVKEADPSGIMGKDVVTNKRMDPHGSVKKTRRIKKSIATDECKEAHPFDVNQKEGIAKEGAVFVTHGKETLLNPVQNVSCLKTHQKMTVTRIPDEDQRCTTDRESVMAAVQEETQVEGTQKDADTVTKPPRCRHFTAIDMMAHNDDQSVVTNRNSCQKVIFQNSTTSVCDSCVNQGKYLTSDDIISDKTKTIAVSNGNHTEILPWNTNVSGNNSSFLTSINAPLSMDLSCIQYSFEELVASADFTDHQQMTKELEGSAFQDSFHCKISQCAESHSGRRKKGKPKKLCVEGPLPPFVAERLRQEAVIQGYDICSDQFKNDKSDFIDPQTSGHRLTYISLCSEDYDYESEVRHQSDDSRHQENNPKESATSYEVERQPVSHMAFQGKNVPSEFQVQTVPQELMQEKRVRKTAEVVDDKTVGTAVDFHGLISFLKNVQLKGSPDFKTTEGNNNYEMSGNKSGIDKQHTFEATRVAVPSQNLTSGNKEESRVLDIRDTYFESNSGERTAANTTVSKNKNANKEDLYQTALPESSKERACSAIESIQERETLLFTSQECSADASTTVSKTGWHHKVVRPETSNTDDETLINPGDPQKGRLESDVSDASESGVIVSDTTCKESDSASVKVQTESKEQTGACPIRVAVRCEPVIVTEGFTELPDLSSDVISITQKITDTSALNAAHQSVAPLSVPSVSSTHVTVVNGSDSSSIPTSMVTSCTLFANKASDSKGLSVRLPRLSDSILEDLFAGNTVKVNISKPFPHLSFRIPAQHDDLFTSPAQHVLLQKSEGICEDQVHSEEISDSDRTVLFGDEESMSDMCWSPAKSDSRSGSPRISTQSHLSEDTSLLRSCQKHTERQLPQKDGSPDPRISEMEEPVQRESQQRSDSVEYGESSVDQSLSESEDKMQCSKKDNGNTTDTTKGVSDKLTEHDKQLNAEGEDAQQGRLSVTCTCSSAVLQLNTEDECGQQTKQSGISNTSEVLQQRSPKRMWKTSEKRQMRRSQVSAKKQMAISKETDGDLQDASTFGHNPTNTLQDSSGTVKNVPSVLTHANADHCPVDTGSSRQEILLHMTMNSNHSALTTVSGIDELRVRAADLPVLDSTRQGYLVGEEISETVCENDLADIQKSSTPVRRVSEESLENVDLPQIITPRRTRCRERSKGYYWKSRHAKTCAIVTKSRLEEHTCTPSDVGAHHDERTETSPISFNCKVVLGTRLYLTQPEVVSAQQDVSHSSFHMASHEHDQDLVQKEEMPTNGRKQQAELDQEMEISKTLVMELGSFGSEMSVQLPSAEVFTPPVAESVKRAASKRKATLQPHKYSDKGRAKTTESISDDILSSVPGVTNGQMQNASTGKRASKKRKVCHCSESEHVSEREKNNTKRPEKKNETNFSESMYVRPDGTILGKILCYPCQQCGAKFKKQVTYIHHLRNGCKECFVCDICSSSFGRKESLKFHKMIHSGESAVHCHICGKKLCGRQSLVTHMRVHTDEKPYRCPDCPRTFRQSSGLTSHYHTHTKDPLIQM